MALVPMLFREWWDDIERPHRLLDQYFGLSLSKSDLLNPVALPPLQAYFRPWRHLIEQDSGSSKIETGKDKFQVILDVQQFAPNEITAKTVDKTIIIEAKHEEKQDEQGYVSRHFVRRYLLPEDHDITRVEASLSSDGVLTVTAPKKALLAPGERIIPVEQTGALATTSANFA